MFTPVHLTSNPLRARGGYEKWRLAGYMLLGVYIVTIGLVVFWPVHVDDNPSGELVKTFLRTGHNQGWLPLWFSYKTVEWLSNVLMFTPGGFLLTLLLRNRTRRWVPLLALATTACIEFTQLWMPGRTSSLWDIVANTLGGTLGWAAALAILWGIYRSKKLKDSASL